MDAGGIKLFGREPTLWLGLISSVLILVGTLGLQKLTPEQAALIVAAINAVFGAINAYAVRPVSPVAFTYAIGALIAVAGAYGLHLSVETIAALNLIVVPALALLTRDQVSPVETPLTKASKNPVA